MLAVAVFLTLCSFALALVALLQPRITNADIQAALPEAFAPDPLLGEALFHIGGCGNCHAARSPDGALTERLAGGPPLETEFGTFHPPNITPDATTGIGAWSDADFLNAMVNGVNPAGMHLFPAFPYTSYARVSYADLLHLKSYLDSLPAENMPSLPHDLRFPYNVRIGVAFWKMAFHDASPWKPNAEMSAEWNRGSYLVNGLGHCGSCHTPRNMFLAEDSARAFLGASEMKRGERPAPRIAGLNSDQILNGLDEWAGSIDEDSSMILVTRAFTYHVAYEDIDAVAAYLSSLPETGSNPRTAVGGSPADSPVLNTKTVCLALNR